LLCDRSDDCKRELRQQKKSERTAAPPQGNDPHQGDDYKNNWPAITKQREIRKRRREAFPKPVDSRRSSERERNETASREIFHEGAGGGRHAANTDDDADNRCRGPQGQCEEKGPQSVLVTGQEPVHGECESEASHYEDGGLRKTDDRESDKTQKEQAFCRGAAVAQVERDQHEQDGSHHIQLVLLYDHGVANEREAICEYEQCDCWSDTGERTFCKAAEEEQADNSAQERKESECEFIVAENCDRAALDEQKSQRGNLVEGQGSREQID